MVTAMTLFVLEAPEPLAPWPADGESYRIVVLTPCTLCGRTARVRWPELWRRCDHCGDRVTPTVQAGLG
jgi:hypothetical protein